MFQRRDGFGTTVLDACTVAKIDGLNVLDTRSARMNEDRSPKRSETNKQGNCIGRGIPQLLRWEDCMKRDLRKAEEEDEWGEKAIYKERWKT